jgi:hypothetical protein
MLEFAGKLMGLSARTKAYLPFTFPSLVWKGLVEEPLTHDDLAASDAVFAHYLTVMRHCERDTGPDGEPRTPVRSEAEFAAAYPDARFTVITSTGAEVELVPGGRDIAVTMANRHRYADAAEALRLHEYDVQLAALRRGLATMVPLRALCLFSWREVETFVAGRPDVDLAVLKRHTRYDGGYSASHAVIKRFWRVLASFTPEDRSRYVRFVWGRARLPADGGSWTSSHTITRLSGGDEALPMSHTCFNTIDMPSYSSEEAMRRQLLVAIHWGIGGILNG